ncbi:DUF2784 domain-containing protein [Methylomonas rapida]|uniref:DUF2784 domain-containing protein n=1 Tax=Methylomonas rapida TaxID=2963939 RepID=A0ABY7GPT3_9GAMM|nr:DUF2784 domain-containing protein [Methylomonas rapida]WAR46506.1 DUF2784 domain-containing protein [Methylomonas rapida]
MFFRLSADAVILLHLAFILFVVFGAALAFRWRWIPFIHLPAAAWGIFIELTSGICPLTYLENHLRRQAGQAGYSGGFIEHYVLNIIYPAGLTPQIQYVLAGIVLVTNIGFYLWLILDRRGRRSA